jgi:hypothetical protein
MPDPMEFPSGQLKISLFLSQRPDLQLELEPRLNKKADSTGKAKMIIFQKSRNRIPESAQKCISKEQDFSNMADIAKDTDKLPRIPVP